MANDTVCTSTGAAGSAMLTMCRPAALPATTARPRAGSAATSVLFPGRSSSASNCGRVNCEASTSARPKDPVATSAVRRLASTVEPMTVTASALPCIDAAARMPVGSARLPNGLMPCLIEVKSSSPSLLESREFGSDPMASSMSSGRPSPSLSCTVLASKAPPVRLVFCPAGALVS